MRQLARWISIVGHPFAMIALLIAVPAAQRSPGDAFQSVMLVVIVVFVPIALLMFRQVRRGLWSNVDASNRSERPILFVIALAGVAAAVAWLRLYNPQSFLVQGMLVIAAFLLVAALLTPLVKLSLHIAFAALTATSLSLAGSWVGYALIAAVPAVFWSRLALARHRVHELVTGLILGAVTGVVLTRL